MRSKIFLFFLQKPLDKWCNLWYNSYARKGERTLPSRGVISPLSAEPQSLTVRRTRVGKTVSRDTSQ